MIARLRSLADGLGAALLAPACVLCRREATGARLCQECLALLVPNGSACARCAEPLPAPTPVCGKCSQRPPAFDAAWAGFQYLAPLDQLVQRLKFDDALAVGRALLPHWLAAFRAHRAQHGDALPAALVPVPLHRSRLRQRGYNQALELARDLGRELGIPVHDALARARATAPMPGLDWDARRRNVRDAFAVTAARLPAHVALVDDVMTSGATVGEAARVLKRAGVQRVEVIVLARKP
ncbi:MAG: ComF family protein [Rhodanobacteraceae bacterium]|nr:ComF family protein [Rhodanobacteraceae bacterium]